MQNKVSKNASIQNSGQKQQQIAFQVNYRPKP
jgi:hypothetical protein